jgi:hypothetical protein
MSIVEELARLEELHRRGALSEAEYAQAKALLLAGGAPPAPSPGEPLAAQLAEVRLQNELARLDREWEIEREQYMLTNRYGQRSIPTAGQASMMGFIVVGFGILWTIGATVMAVSSSSFLANHPLTSGPEVIFPWLFPCFGIVFIAFGIMMSLRTRRQADAYQRAYQNYQARRAQVLQQAGATGQHGGSEAITRRRDV